MRKHPLLLSAVLTAMALVGCSVPPASTVAAPAPAKPASPPPPATVAKPPEAPKPPAVVEKPPEAPSPPAAVAKASPPAPKPPAAKPAPAPAPAPVAAAPSPPKASAPPALDLKTLEQRLKDTGAIGVLTKLSLKNQVDDLVDRFKAFHAGQRPPTLTELKPAFDLLLMKVLSLLQDKDAALARDIDASRDGLWGLLSDRDKFSRYASR